MQTDRHLTLPCTFVPPPGGRLLCLWVYPEINLRRIRTLLHTLVKQPACGVTLRADRQLVLIWTEGYLQHALVTSVLTGLGDMLDWSKTIEYIDNWEPWFGEPWVAEPGFPVIDVLNRLRPI